MFLRPTPLAVRFMQLLVHHVMWGAPWQWEQAAWNDVLMYFLWGSGEQDQLRYRLLPVSRYCNVGERLGRGPVLSAAWAASAAGAAEALGQRCVASAAPTGSPGTGCPCLHLQGCGASGGSRASITIQL